MTADEPQGQPVEIHADEDWKQRVKAEDAALDQKLAEEQREEKSTESQTEAASPADEPKIDAQDLPPADFSLLVGMFSTQALVAMGVIPNPASGKAEPQLALARHFIDLLGVLEEKTKGNLDTQEESLIHSTLHELRMAFVQQSKTGQAE